MNANNETIRASMNILDLTGIGYEWLLDQQGNVIAIFFNGQMSVTKPELTVEQASEITKVA